MERDFLLWPPAMKLTFTSAMNLLKLKKRMKRETLIKRHDVYLHMREHLEKFRRVFGETEPWENQIYEYMDRFVDEGLFTIVQEMRVKGRRIQDLASTSKAEQLYEWLWISTNLKSKEDVGQIVSNAIKDMENLSADEKEVIVKRTVEKIDENRIIGFPFSISRETVKKLLDENDKKMKNSK